MSGNINNNERSMNGIISINAEDLKVNNLDANNINVENLEIENSLLVNTTTISPDEIQQLNGINTNETIQTQINNINTNISNNLVTKTGTQTISGDKTFSGTTTFSGNIDVNSLSISPAELSTLDGIDTTLTIQEQLNNAGISNAMTLNTQQVATGQKTFTAPLGVSAFQLIDTTATIIGYLTNATNLIYASISGTISVTNSTILGNNVQSTISSQITRTGVSNGTLVLNTNQTPTTSSYNTDGYYSNTLQPSTTNYLYFFNNVTNIQPLTGSTYFTGIKWNSSSSVTTPAYTDDFVLHKNSSNPFGITMSSNSSPTINRNFSAKTGYLSNATTFTSLNTLTNGDFLEGTGLIPPVQITAVNGNNYTITSPNTITPTASSNTINGYFDTTTDFYYYNQTGTATIGNFLSNSNLSFDVNISAIDTATQKLTLTNNTFTDSADFTLSGYVEDANNLQITDVTNVSIGKFIKNSNIPLGKHFVTAITGKKVTLANSTITIPTRTQHDGYLFTNNILVATGTFVLNNFVIGTDIPDKQTLVSSLNANEDFINLSTTNNVPTPNNKTYNGFSPNSTTFYYNNNNTNVAINYYLKNNAITSPTIDHLITIVNTSNKQLTTANLPTTTSTSSTTGYAVGTSIITETAQNLSVGTGIDTTLINVGERFIGTISGVTIGGFTSVNAFTPTNDIDGYTNSSISVIAYDPNNRLVLGNFIRADNSSIPENSKIQTIIPLNNDFKQVNFTPSGGVGTIFNDRPSFKPNANTIYVNQSGLLDKVYQTSTSRYGKITSNPFNGTYGTTDTQVGNVTNVARAINILLSDGTRAVFFGATNASTYTNKLFYLQTFTNYNNFLVTKFPKNGVQNALLCDNPVNTNIATSLYFDYNKGNSIATNPNIVNNSFGLGYIYKPQNANFYFLMNTNVTPFQYHDYIFERTGSGLTNFVANINPFNGIWVGNQTTGNATQIEFQGGNPPPHFTTSAERGFITLASTYNASVTQFLVYNSFPFLNPVGGQFIFSGSGTFFNYARITNYNNQGNGTTLITIDRSFPIGKVGDNILQLFQLGQFQKNLFALRPQTTYTPQLVEQVTLSYPQPSHETQYESITPTPINFYSNLDSYNSYLKQTFEQIPPLNFSVFNNNQIAEKTPITYNSFEKLNFTIYNNLETFTAQTSTNQVFPTNLITADDTIVLQDTFAILEQKFIRDCNILQELRLDSQNSQMRMSTSGIEILDFSIGTQSIQYKFEGDGTQIDLRSTNNTTKNSGTKIGYVGYNGFAGFMNRNLAEGASNYALMQNTSGKTLLNSSNGQTLDIRVNNTNKMQFFGHYTLSNIKFSNPNQVSWYMTNTQGGNNQSYNAGSRIGSTGFVVGYGLVRHFNSQSIYGTSASGWNAYLGTWTNNEGAGYFLINLYAFCNNAQNYNGRIVLITTPNRRSQNQYNMDVNRNTTGENCSLLSWCIYMEATDNFYIQVQSGGITLYMADTHTNLRVTKIA